MKNTLSLIAIVAVAYFSLNPLFTDNPSNEASLSPPAIDTASVSTQEEKSIAQHQPGLRIDNNDYPPNVQKMEADALEPFELPDKPELSGLARPKHVQLWDIDDSAVKTTIDGIAALQFQFDIERLKTLAVGQSISFNLPDHKSLLEAEITGTHNDPAGVQIWLAQMQGQIDRSSVIITRGRHQTHIVIASLEGNYSVIVDNQSGQSTIMDEGLINENQAPIDDGIVYEPSAL